MSRLSYTKIQQRLASASLLVGNMMQSVVLDGNPLNEDEDMRLMTCVVLDGKPSHENMLDLMDLVNDVNLMVVDNMMLSVVLERQLT